MKALALVSGGLDSLLAAKVIQDQGVEVHPVYFNNPFYSRKRQADEGYARSVKKTAVYLGVELKMYDLSLEFLGMLDNPRYGYGSHSNPCIDCKILMLRQAKILMSELSASFVVTGEVLGQRPMSQKRKMLKIIEEESGLNGLLVRPLCARLLEETIPEKEGWIRRDGLLSFNGRGRRLQMDLAARFGFNEYANPAGGCLLTDPYFSKRVEDLIRHKGLTPENVELLRVGRHFRITDKAKLVVARDEKEGHALAESALPGDYMFFPPELIAGASALGRGDFSRDALLRAGSLVSRYFDLSGKKEALVEYRVYPEGKKLQMDVPVIEEKLLEKMRLS